MTQNIDIVRKAPIKKEIATKAPLRKRSAKSVASCERVMEENSPERSRVFSFWYRLYAATLLCVFLLQPTTSVFASEEGSGEVSAEQESEIVIEETIPLEPTELSIEDGPREEKKDVETASTEDTLEESDVDTGLEILESEEGDAVLASVENSAVENVSNDSDASAGSDESTEIEEAEVAEATSTSTAQDVVDGIDTPVSGTTTADVEDIEEELEETIAEQHREDAEVSATTTPASTTEEVGVVMPEVSEGVSDLNRYQFGVNDCVTVEDGFFYCSKGTMPKITAEDRVYAAQDADGDFEIFISKDGVDTQITHNLVDDNAPQYDAKSNRLAWHSLVNDRYQILVYDFANESMVQLTDETFNSMEPAMLGERTVWQAWVVNNWEIILDDNGERTQLTSNETHDIDPFIRGDLISWQSQNGEGWDIKIFNIETKELDIVSGAGGASAQNPRFVLMYDSTKENGDVETVGYDIESGETIPLAAVPRSVPDTIPEPPHSKEKSAFVQTNPTLKNEVEAEVDDAVGTTTVSGGDDVDESDIVIPPAVSTTTVATAAVATTTDSGDAPAPVVVGMDLDLRAMATSTDAVVSHSIPDLVIPPVVSVETNASSSEPL